MFLHVYRTNISIFHLYLFKTDQMVQLKGWARNILLIAGGIFLIFLIWYFSAIVTYILISVVLSFIGRPLVRWLSNLHYKNIRIPKGIAAFITLIAIGLYLFPFSGLLYRCLLTSWKPCRKSTLKHSLIRLRSHSRT